MFVDTSDLINEFGVSEIITIEPISFGYGTDEFGDMVAIDPIKIENIQATIIETTEDGMDGVGSSYVSRIVYDVYIPSNISLEMDLVGSTVTDSDGRKFLANKILLSRRYASHAVIRCTEVKNK